VGVGSRGQVAGVRARTQGHRAGRSSVVLFWSERVRVQPTSQRKFFSFFFAPRFFFSRRNWEKKDVFRLILKRFWWWPRGSSTDIEFFFGRGAKSVVGTPWGNSSAFE